MMQLFSAENIYSSSMPEGLNFQGRMKGWMMGWTEGWMQGRIKA
jgi:hypothetical protein